jgi:signal transduction histidine kinase
MIVIAFCIPLARLIQVVATNRALDAAKLESRTLAGALVEVTDGNAVKQLVEQANAGDPRPIAVYLPDGTVLGAQIPLDAEVQLARQGRSFTAAAPGGGRDILVGIVTGGGPRVVRVRVAGTLLNQGVHRAWAIVLAVGALVVLIAVLLADRLGQSIVAPMGELLSVTRQLQGGELSARVKPAGPPEVEEVGLAVNELAERIGVLLAAEGEAAADLSHQLRTPLTVLRLDAEGIGSPIDRVRIASDIDRLEKVVTQVINESREVGQRGTRPRRGRSDLGQAVHHRLTFWSVLAEDQGRKVSSNIPPGRQPIAVSTAELDVLVDALLNNVFTHTPAGTPFDVEVHPAGNRRWTLVVQDSGPGLPGDSLPRRGASGGSGTGLGLDIVRRTAEGSGGDVVAGRSARGGARIEVTFGPPDDFA